MQVKVPWMTGHTSPNSGTEGEFPTFVLIGEGNQMTSTQRDEADTGEDKAAQPPHSEDNMTAASDDVSGGDAGDSADESSQADIAAEPADPMEALLQERDSLKDQLLRALAEVENMRRRTERELESARKYAHTGFARDLVGAIDNLARAISAAPAKDEAASAEAIDGLVTGLEMSWQEIQTTMERHGIRQISPKAKNSITTCIRRCSKFQTVMSSQERSLKLFSMAMFCMTDFLRPAMVGVSRPQILNNPQIVSRNRAEAATLYNHRLASYMDGRLTPKEHDPLARCKGAVGRHARDLILVLP